MSTSKPPYPPEFRREAVRLVQTSGKSRRTIAHDLGISTETLRQWVRQAELDAGVRHDGLTTAEREELRRLRRENQILREEREKANHAVARLCRVLGVSPSGYYACRQRQPSARAQADAALTERIRASHARSRGTYGAPRIHADLAAGVHCGRKRVARLMRTASLVGGHRRGTVRTTQREPDAPVAPDRVHRQFVASAPDQLWTAAITYVAIWAGFLYLAVVLEVFSRRIVGWAMADHLRTELVLAALDIALWNRRPAPGVIHHSDHGGQYTSLAFGTRCQEAGVIPSFGSRGDCFDNAITESFFATVECELLDRHTFRTHAEARTALFDYIDGFYNPHRRHSALGYRSPADHERSEQLEAAA